MPFTRTHHIALLVVVLFILGYFLYKVLSATQFP